MANNEWEELLDEEYEALGDAEGEPDSFDDEIATGGVAAPNAPARAFRTGRHPAGPSSNPAEYFAQEREEEPASAAERLAKLVETMPGQTKTLTRILDLCRIRQPTGDVLTAVAEWQRRNFSVYEPAMLCSLLEKAGGLEHVDEDGSPYVRERANDAQATPADGMEAAGAAEDVGAPTSEDAPGALPDDAEADFDVTCAQPATSRPSFWVATPAGLDLVAEHDPRAHVAQMLDDEAFYLPVYRELLERLADGPMTKKEMDVIVRANPITESPRRLGGYFVDRLERIEAIEWTGAWSITDIGRELLENEALYQ